MSLSANKFTQLTFDHGKLKASSISHIRLKNFRSFNQVQTAGPFLRVTSIIGGNGNGKSSIINGLIFCLGGRESSGGKAEVQVFLRMQDESQVRLARLQNPSKFYINYLQVELAQYRKFVVDKLGPIDALILTQGQIQSLTVKSAQSLCNYFQQLSGSIRFKQDYERLKAKQNHVLLQLKDVTKLQSQLNQERKSLRLLADSGFKYKELLQQLEKVQSLIDEVQLGRIYGKISELQRVAVKEGSGKIKEHEQSVKDLNIKIIQCEKEAKAQQQAQRKYVQQKSYYQKYLSQIKAQERLLVQSIQRQKAILAYVRPYVQQLLTKKKALDSHSKAQFTFEAIDPQYLELSLKLQENCNRTTSVIKELQIERANCLCAIASAQNLLSSIKLKNSRIELLQAQHISQKQRLSAQKKELLKQLDSLPELQVPNERSGHMKQIQVLQRQALQLRLSIQQNDKFSRLRQIPGVLGKVQDLLIIASKKYLHLQSHILGKYRGVICVKGETDIQRIRAMGFEQVKIIIMSNLKDSKEVLAKREIDGMGILAQQLFQYNPEILNIRFLLKLVSRGKVICKDFVESKALQRKRIKGLHQIISLQGTLFKQDGLIIASPLKFQKTQNYSRLYELRKEIQQLKAIDQGLNLDNQAQAQAEKRKERRMEIMGRIEGINEFLSQGNPPRVLEETKYAERQMESEQLKARRIAQLIKKQQNSLTQIRAQIFKDYYKKNKITNFEEFHQKHSSEAFRQAVIAKHNLTHQTQLIDKELSKANLEGIINKIQKLEKVLNELKSKQVVQPQQPAKKDFLKRLSGLQNQKLKTQSQIEQLKKKCSLPEQQLKQLYSKGKQIIQSGKGHGIIDFFQGSIKFVRKPNSDLNLNKLQDQKHQLLKRVQEYQGLSAGLMGNNKHRLDRINQRLQTVQQRFQLLCQQHRVTSEEAEKVLVQRRETFMKVYRRVEQLLPDIYKLMTYDQNLKVSGNALICLENQALPFEQGIIYSPTPPTKRFIYDSISQLSGGQKTIASISLIYALTLALDCPTLILDQPDAYLDNENVSRLLMLMRRARQDKRQVVVVTHKEQIYGSSESIVGVTKDDKDSRCLSLDLR